MGRTFSERYGATAEVNASTVLQELTAAGTPVEGLIGGWYRASDDVVVRAGAGMGFTRGIGSPDARVILGVGFEPV